MNNQLSFIPLGGIGDVTKNMYLYEYGNEILIVDCGLGFADETMLGVDLLLPDISYLLQKTSASGGKKIVGMVITHGHEDHMGGLPFILPQLPQFPIFASPFTAALANAKLKEFRIGKTVQTVQFNKGNVSLGSFNCFFIRVTHSIPDTAHILIQTPVGNMYHGSDFKFDETPHDGKKSDYETIRKVGEKGILCLLSDCLGAERIGHLPSETTLSLPFEKEIQRTLGKCIVTTYSSQVARINQIIDASEKADRKVCFIGRSFLNTKDVAKKIGYLYMKETTEIPLDQLNRYPDNKVTLIVAGSQGQEESAMARIANGEHREVKLSENDTVIFSSDPIPGNEMFVYELVDTIARWGARVIYPPLSRDFHVSGHGIQDELAQLITLTKPKFLIPIGGNFRHMVAYKNLAFELGFPKSSVLLLDDGKEIVFSVGSVRPGRTIQVRNVYVDEISGEEVESFVLRDRQKLSEHGIVIVISEVDSVNGQLISKPDLIIRGFSTDEIKSLTQRIFQDLRALLQKKRGRVTNWVYIRKLIGDTVERRIFKDLKRRPLVLPVIIEV